MRQSLIILAAVIFSCAQPSPSKNSLDGFAGYPWGTPVVDIPPDLLGTKLIAAYNAYDSPMDTVFGCGVSDCFVIFTPDWLLLSVTITAKNAIDADSLLFRLMQKCGTGQPVSHSNNWLQNQEFKCSNTVIRFSRDLRDQSGKALFSSVNLIDSLPNVIAFRNQVP